MLKTFYLTMLAHKMSSLNDYMLNMVKIENPTDEKREVIVAILDACKKDVARLFAESKQVDKLTDGEFLAYFNDKYIS